jgi:O-antigen ligase
VVDCRLPAVGNKEMMRIEAIAANRMAYFAAVAFTALVMATVAFSGSPLLGLAAASGTLLFVLFLLRVQWGIYALLLASACTAVSVEVANLTVRPEQVVTLVLAAVLFFSLFSGKRPAITSSLDWLIFSYLLVNVLSSLLHAPDVKTSLQKCLLLTITFTAYFVSTQIIRSNKLLSRIILFLVLLGVVEAIYGIVSVFLFTRGINIGGAHAPYGDIYARGTFIEGNIFGSFQMIIALILTSFLFSSYFKQWKAALVIALALVLVSSIMSFTRAAWLGFLLGFFVYSFFLRRQVLARILQRLPILFITLLLIGTLGYTLSVSIKKGNVSLLDLYVARFQRILDSRSTTASSRLQVWEKSIEFWRRNPFLGNGTDSIKVLARGTNMPMFGDDYWIPNSMILALHDTGIVGLLLFSAIQIAFLMKLWLAMRRTKSAYHQAVLEGFFAAFIGVQVAYFFTNAFWLVFIWVFMAIGISCCRLSMELPDGQPSR